MSNELRFSEKDIARIFEEAARAQNASFEEGQIRDGLSLAELQQIGASTGIKPEFIAKAVAKLQRKPAPIPVKKHLGIPIEVARTVELPDTFSEQDWEHLVVDLRSTFGALGKIKKEGSFREWSNGNLHAAVEPTPGGYQLRLRTKKGNMLGFLYGSFAYSLVGLIMFLSVFFANDTNAPLSIAVIISSIFFLLGLAGVSSVSISQPRWASKRLKQMEDICERALEKSLHTSEEEMVEEFITGIAQASLKPENRSDFQERVRPNNHRSSSRT